MKRKVKPLEWFEKNCVVGSNYYYNRGETCYYMLKEMLKNVGKKIILDENMKYENYYYDEWMLEPLEPKIKRRDLKCCGNCSDFYDRTDDDGCIRSKNSYNYCRFWKYDKTIREQRQL